MKKFFGKFFRALRAAKAAYRKYHIKTFTLNTAVKRVPTGFSWTTLFFGPFPALFRGDLKWAAIQFIVNFAVAAFTWGFGLIVTFMTFAVIYNDRYEQDLRAAGWTELTAEQSA